MDILYNLRPFSSSTPRSLENVHNPHLSDLVTIYYRWIEAFRSWGSMVPLWNPYSFCGSPLLPNAQNGALFPLNWLWRLLPAGFASLVIALPKCGSAACLLFSSDPGPGGIIAADVERYEPERVELA